MNRRHAVRALALAALAMGVAAWAAAARAEGAKMITIRDALEKKDVTVETVERTEAQWRERLSPLAYDVLRDKGTERAFTGPLNSHKGDGVYACAGCGTHLFDSADKYESGTGWPSFTRPVDPRNIGTEKDVTFFMVRTEVHCARCGGHLGHVFEDGPPPSGLRYCMNSVSLTFLPRK